MTRYKLESKISGAPRTQYIQPRNRRRFLGFKSFREGAFPALCDPPPPCQVSGLQPQDMGLNAFNSAGCIAGREKSLNLGLLVSLPFLTVLATLDKAAKLVPCLGLSFSVYETRELSSLLLSFFPTTCDSTEVRAW